MKRLYLCLLFPLNKFKEIKKRLPLTTGNAEPVMGEVRKTYLTFQIIILVQTLATQTQACFRYLVIEYCGVRVFSADVSRLF